MGQEHMMGGHTSKQNVTLLCQHILSSALYNHFPLYVPGTGRINGGCVACINLHVRNVIIYMQ